MLASEITMNMLKRERLSIGRPVKQFQPESEGKIRLYDGNSNKALQETPHLPHSR